MTRAPQAFSIRGPLREQRDSAAVDLVSLRSRAGLPRRLRSLVILGVLSLVAGAVASATEKPVVVVTTSMGATAVHDLVGDAVDVETLMPPGTCPGQFDLEPQQVRRVRTAVLVIRHEMQRFLDERFIAAGVRNNAAVTLSFGGPFTVPVNYARFCEAIAHELARRVPALEATARAHLAAIRARAEAETTALRRSAAALAGTRVVAAAYQADFLRWLGFEVVATFPPDEDSPPRTLLAVIAAGRERGAVLVVGNEQNGWRVPAAIADALKVEVVMLSNFPAQDTTGAYWELVQANLQALLGWKANRAKAQP